MRHSNLSNTPSIEACLKSQIMGSIIIGCVKSYDTGRAVVGEV